MGGCGLGWCLRDDNGSFVAGAAYSWPGKWTPLGAELLGIRKALSWIKQYGWNEVEVETDAIRAVAEITLGSSCSSIGLLGEDIRDLTKSFMNISFSHIMRSANKTAHALARAACSLSESRSWFYTSSSFIVS
ncbi:unnamed protein product [Cuscuta epithymum]|uniref:RNase H type-1 domain-containing protein n=1 Tax=Cuscuta epithymum TaxID=186058 RepID=A0AAV0FD29_9ASTE|nr:unnamed protein product [Cuscuta epithymum]